MAEPSWTEHVAVGATWRRFGFMLLFVPVLCCAGILIGFTALFQFFSMLASGETNPQLTGFGRELSRLAAAVMDYLTYNRETRPFPFGPWPASDLGRSPPPPPRPRGAKRPPRARSGRKRSRRSAASTEAPARGAPVADSSDAAIGIGGGEVPRRDDETP